MTEWKPEKRRFNVGEFVEDFRGQPGNRGMGAGRAAVQGLLLAVFTGGAAFAAVSGLTQGKFLLGLAGAVLTVVFGFTTWALWASTVAIVRERSRGPMRFDELEDVVERVPERRDAWPQNQPGTAGWTPPPVPGADDGAHGGAVEGPVEGPAEGPGEIAGWQLPEGETRPG